MCLYWGLTVSEGGRDCLLLELREYLVRENCQRSQCDDEQRGSQRSGSMFPVIFWKELYLDLKNEPLCLILALASELPPSKFAGLLFCHCEPRAWDNDGRYYFRTFCLREQ